MVGRFHGVLLLSAKRWRPLVGRKTLYERRFGKPFEGLVTPFCSMIEYHPISAKDLSRTHQLGKTVLPGMFLGYALHAGRIWKGDILVADIEELENLGASEIHARRLNAKEVITPKNGEHFICPIAEVKVKLSGRDQVLRTSTFTPERGEEREDLRGESDGSQPLNSFPNDSEARNDFYFRELQVPSSR